MGRGGSRRSGEDMSWKSIVCMGGSVPEHREHVPFVFERAWKPPCDVFETERHYVVVVEIAGVSFQEVEVIQQGRQLLIKGHRRDITTFPKKDFYQMEIYFGPFFREVELPYEIDFSSIKAYYRNGLLVIECLKRGDKKEKRIHIE